jgi:uncharacterized protein YheU (UPF0270 family)
MSPDETPDGEGVLVDYQALAPDTLRSLVEDFVTRDGTDYGVVEASIERRVGDVMAQLKRGDAVIAFDPVTASATIVVRPRRP